MVLRGGEDEQAVVVGVCGEGEGLHKEG